MEYLSVFLCLAATHTWYLSYLEPTVHFLNPTTISPLHITECQKPPRLVICKKGLQSDSPPFFPPSERSPFVRANVRKSTAALTPLTAQREEQMSGDAVQGHEWE